MLVWSQCLLWNQCFVFWIPTAPSKLDNRGCAIIRLGKVNGGKHHQWFELVGKENHSYERKCKEFLQIEKKLSLLSQRLFHCTLTWVWRSVLPELPISICKPFSKTRFKPQASWVPSWFSFCLWPWIQPWRTLTESSQRGAVPPASAVFYQLISNTWSHANPLTPQAVCLCTHKQEQTHRHTTLTRFFSPNFATSSPPLSFQLHGPGFRARYRSLLLSLSIIFSIWLFIYFSLYGCHSPSSVFSDSPPLFPSSLHPLLLSFSLPPSFPPFPCFSVSVCWVEVWSGNQSIKSETHRTRGSQPHKSPLVQPTSSRVKNTACLNVCRYLSACTSVCVCVCVCVGMSDITMFIFVCT